jgi:hypothetical protein
MAMGVFLLILFIYASSFRFLLMVIYKFVLLFFYLFIKDESQSVSQYLFRVSI